MRNINILTLLIYLFLTACQKDVEVNSGNEILKVYDFSVTSAKETKDGGYILSTTNSIVKLSGDGKVQWGKKYTDFNSDTSIFTYTPYGKSIENTDGSFTLMIYGIIKDNSYYFLIKLDKDGNKQWARPLNFDYVNTVFTDAFSVIESYDHGYIVTFAYQDNSPYNYFRALIKVDEKGIPVWENKDLKYLEDPYFADVRDIMEAKNHEIILVGTLDLTRTYFAKYSADGIIMQERAYRMSGLVEGAFVTNIATKVIQTTSNDLLIFGFTDRGKGYSKKDFQFMMIKVNSDGDSLASAILGTTKQDYCWGGIQTKDMGYALIGTSTPIDDEKGEALKSSMYFIKLSPNLDVEKALVYGEKLDTKGLYIKENNDKSYTLIGGKYGHENLGKPQTVFIRTLPNGGL